MEIICRVCTNKKKRMTSIFKPSGRNGKPGDLLKVCTSVQVSEEDGLPQNICIKCLKDLILSYNFKRRSEQSDRKLRRLLVKNTRCRNSSKENSTINKIITNDSDESNFNVQAFEDYIGEDAPSPITVSKDDSGTGTESIVLADDTQNSKNTEDEIINEVLVKLVKKYPILYSTNRVGYGIREEQEKAWGLIALEMNLSVSVLKERWRNLRLCLGRYMRQKNSPELTYKSKKPYYLAKYMEFLLPFTKWTSSNNSEEENQFKTEYETQECKYSKDNNSNDTVKRTGKIKKAIILKSGKSKNTTKQKLSKPCDSEKVSNERPFHCNECQKTFACFSGLTAHQRMHSGEKPYKCEYCSKRFRHKSHCRVHELIHTDKEKYREHLNKRKQERLKNPYIKQKRRLCDVCGKGFSSPCYLERHMRIHTGSRPFKCSFCVKAFGDPSALTKHELKHSGDRPYVCGQCSKRFCDRSNYRRHLKLHRDDKPYSCAVCSKSFIAPSILKYHMKTHTSEDKFV